MNSNPSTRQPLVSIIIPSYKHAQFVAEAIDSALTQTYPNIEVIVINDGSPDNTVEVCAAFGNKIKYIEQENNGPGAARNTGIRASKGDCILPLDGDDILDPNFLAETVPHLLANDEIGFVYTNAKCFTGTEVGRDTVTPFSYPWDYGRMLTENLASVTSLFRKADWQQVGGFRERPRHGFEDWDFWLRIMELGKIGHYVPLPLFLCRRHVEPTSRDYSNNQQYVECYRLIIQAHRALYAAHWEEVLDAWAKRWALACDLMAESRDIEQRYWRERPGRLERFGLPVPLARLLRNVRHRLNQ